MALTYFTLAQLRALPDMSDAGRYTDALCTAAGEFVESRIEEFVTTAFFPRQVTDEVHDGNDANARGGWLQLRRRHPLAITACSQNGVQMGAGELADLSLKYRTLRRRAPGSYAAWLDWAPGHENILVSYTHAYSASVPNDIREAALQWTRGRLLATASLALLNDRTSSVSNETGGTTSFVIAGEDRPSGFPDVDSVLLNWRNKITKGPGIS